MEPDKVLADIIQTELSLPAGRTVLYDQNFKSPDDDLIYIVIALQSSRVIGSNNRFKPGTNQEEKYISLSDTYNIEITSKNRDALLRYPEVIAALTSNYSQQKQEENQIAIFRTAQVMDLSFIEGGSSLHRYRIPVIINSTKIIEKVIDYYDKYQSPEEAIT